MRAANVPDISIVYPAEMERRLEIVTVRESVCEWRLSLNESNRRVLRCSRKRLRERELQICGREIETGSVSRCVSALNSNRGIWNAVTT